MMKRFTNQRIIRMLWLPLMVLFFSSLTGQVMTSFDLYLLNVKTGETEQLTYLPDIMVFNASFSNNGQYIVAEGVGPDGAGLGIVDVQTGEAWGLQGGEGGNDASWSPNGEWIVFDGLNMGIPNLYLIPPGGGIPVLVRELGIDAEWAQDSEWIVFRDVTDNSIRTMNIYTGVENMIFSSGFGPSWSPNGNFIAFSDNENLFMIPVDEYAMAAGPPVQITFDGPNVYNQQPTWSNNSKMIAFHSNRGEDPLAFDFNIWMVPAAGGTPSMIAGFEGSGDFDPCFSKNGKWIVFTSTSYYGSPEIPVIRPETGQEDVMAMDENYPNPFSHETTIRIHLNRRQMVRLHIFDSKGALVQVLADQELDSGTHRFTWDGTSQSGKKVSDGIYTGQLIAGNKVITQRMVLLR